MESEAIDGDTFFLQLLDEIVVGCCFGTGTFDIEIVGVEFGVRVCGLGGVEGCCNIFRTGRVEKHVLAEGSVVIDNLWREVRR